MKVKKRPLGILFSLVMALGLMSGMTLTAYAAQSTDTFTGFNSNLTYTGNHIKLQCRAVSLACVLTRSLFA